jgi:hypothetical protein
MKSRTFVVLATLAGAGACAIGMAAGADYSPNIDFTRYSSFTFDEPDDRPVGDPRLENNPLFEARVHAAIALELATRGVTQDAEGPALIVHHHATVRDRVDVYETDRQAGYGAPDWEDATQVVEYEEGTFIVDIADAETRDLIWRGWTRFDIGSAMGNPRAMADAIDDAIAEMFERYPVPAR